LAGSKSDYDVSRGCWSHWDLTVQVLRGWDGSLYAETNGTCCGPACNVTVISIDEGCAGRTVQWLGALFAEPEIVNEMRNSYWADEVRKS
jgi:hypothetical protein